MLAVSNVPIFAWNVHLVSQVFLKRSLIFLILLFSSLSLHCSLKTFFSPSLLFSGTLHSDGYIFPFSLCLLLLFSVICKASSDNHFVFLHFSFFGLLFVTASCTMLQTSVHSSSGNLSNQYVDLKNYRLLSICSNQRYPIKLSVISKTKALISENLVCPSWGAKRMNILIERTQWSTWLESLNVPKEILLIQLV